MSALRITLVDNAQQTRKAVLLLPPERSEALSAIQAAAKGKLRIKKVAHVFNAQGVDLLQQPIAQLQNGDQLWLSRGEPFVGKPATVSSSSASVRLIANKAEVTPDAVTQLHNVAKLPGMVQVVGLPDLHAGQQSPIGAAYISSDRIYPALVDQDIGCGMSFWSTQLKSNVSPDKLAKELDIEGPFKGAPPSHLPCEMIGEVDFVASLEQLGSIGGGNHFAELQRLDKVFLPEAWPAQVDQQYLFLLVHSGSRGLGKAILQSQPEGALAQETPAFSTYLKQHEAAVEWAKINRQIIASRLLECLGHSLQECHQVLELVHNNVARVDNGWLHRKGAAPAIQGQLGIIPGSRGHRTWLIRVTGDQSANAHSIAHGAGRAITRTKALETAQRSSNRKAATQDLSHTDLGGVVICENKNLIVEEQPACYKDVDLVVQDLVDAGLVQIVASFKPVVTYKTRAQAR